MNIGQKVWHVGKNVITKEVTVLWMSIEACAHDAEGPVLVRYNTKASWETAGGVRYALIPRRQLSETKPIVKCKASRIFHINGPIVWCDRAEGHETLLDNYQALHHAKGLDVEIYWNVTPRITALPNPA